MDQRPSESSAAFADSWEVTTGRNNVISSLILSPDGKRLLAVSRIRRAWVLDPDTLEPLTDAFQTKGWISCAAFSPDGQTAILGIGGGEGYANRGEVHFWHFDQEKLPEQPLTLSGRVTSMDVQPNKTVLAIATLAGIREKLKYSDVPQGLRGLGITFITVGLMSLGFMSFSGIQL